MMLRVLLLVLSTLSLSCAPLAADTTTGQTAAAIEEAARPDVKIDKLKWHVLGLTVQELAELADMWGAHLADNLQAISDTATASDNSPVGKSAGAADFGDLVAKNDQIMDRYAVVLSAWEKKGGVDKEIGQHRDFMRGSIAQLLSSADVPTMLVVIVQWAFSWRGGVSLLVQTVVFFAAIWALLVLGRVVARALDRQLVRKATIPALQRAFLRNGAAIATVTVGIVFLLVRNGANFTLIAAVIGGIGVMLAVSMQNALGNIAGGLLLALFRPFDLGQVVRIGDVTGRIEHFELAATTIRQFDNLPVRIPNEEVWRSRLSNYSAPESLRIDLVFNIGFPQDSDLAIETLRAVIEREATCRKDPPPDVFVAEIGEASVAIYCRAWVAPADYWTTAWSLTGAGVAALHQAGIQIANPFYDVRLQPAGTAS